MKWKFGCEFGWFKGEDWCLFQIYVLNFDNEVFVQLFKIKILKFIIAFDIEKNK